MPMKMLVRLIAALVMLSGAVPLAQAPSITGQWQGTLNVGRELRTVVLISNADGGGLRGLLYSIDQGTQGMNAAPMLLGQTFKLTITALSATYEGMLSPDGKTITGTMTQNGKPVPLTLTRATGDAAWALPEAPKPMAPDAIATFEVATIKPSNPDRQGKVMTMKGRQVITINTTTTDLITFAYELHARQIVGGPSWMESDKYDVTGLPNAAGTPDMHQLRGMLSHLLSDRYKLTFHREKRELPIYAITVATGGPKMTKNDSNPNGLPGLFFRGLGALPGVNATVGDLAGVMQSAVLDRPVIDRSGLAGRWDFTLNWTPDESQFAGLGVRVPPPSSEATAPSLFTAFQEQLGLKLEPTRGPVDVLVIDTIERPSEN
jgi:uncharacterized protein (TIGR03435 family)